MEAAVPLQLSRIHFPVTTLGVGRRVGIWLQGCSIRCPGCISADTWAAGRGQTTVGEVFRLIEPWLIEADGVTISGGEPFDQVEGLEALLHRLRARLPATSDVLVYSGHPWARLLPFVRQWKDLIDVLVSEPFVAEAGQTLLWRGSDNQIMHLLTALGRERYSRWQAARRRDQPKLLDIALLDDEVWLAGIPEPGTLAALQLQLAANGFTAKNSQATSAAVPPIFA